MDPKGISDEQVETPRWGVTAVLAASAGVIVLAAAGLGFAWAQGFSTSQAAGELVASYGHVFVSVQEKVDQLRGLDEENQRLRLENAHLRLALESENYEKYADKAEKLTGAYEWTLSREAGSSTGRTLASIPYKIPTDLIPSQLYVLGTNYFNAREDEKAAVILSFLTGMDGDDSYKTPQNFMLAGIAWYRLKNFELADFNFDRVLQSRDLKSIHGLREQARLWKGLAAEQQGRHTVAQYWLREVMDHDPHSVETQWINQLGVGREPAAQHGD